MVCTGGGEENKAKEIDTAEPDEKPNHLIMGGRKRRKQEGIFQT